MGSARPPLVLGHRGYRARFPENTLRAFREALGAGADGIECDLQKTADGRYVIVHDADTRRVAGAECVVATSPLRDIQSLDVGGGERIPTLEELLDSLPPGIYLDLELKEETLVPEDCQPIREILDRRITRSNLMISSFDPRLLVPFRSAGYTVGFLVGEELAARGPIAFARTLMSLRPQYVNLPIDTMRLLGHRRAAWVARILVLMGFSLLFWTVNEPEEARFAARYGNIIVTDEVGRILAAVKSHLP